MFSFRNGHFVLYLFRAGREGRLFMRETHTTTKFVILRGALQTVKEPHGKGSLEGRKAAVGG